MSNWCLGCGKEIRNGDWCVLCTFGVALDPEQGIVPIPAPVKLPPEETGIVRPQDDEDFPF